MKPQALVSWSSGKDSAFALHEVQRAGALEVVGLVTTVNGAFERVAMHAVRVADLR
jgi:diphthamide synthase (EF-2-diphthine--ammonia ligase)